jgi:Rod binding domain-containing protein
MSIRIAPTSHPQGSATSLLTELQNQGKATKTPAKGELAVREKFQDFVGGTFYKEMLKALRAAQKPSKYLNGGQAEKICQSQMDQQIAEDLAHQYAGHLAAPLFESYARQSLSGSSPVAEGANAFNVVA